MPRFSHMHPYPAMVPEDVAEELCALYVKRSVRVLDPFCGSGRFLLAAAELGADCVGVDVNPLATLLLRAKSARIGRLRAEELLSSFDRFDFESVKDVYELEPGRKVEWFSTRSKTELSRLISWINSEERPGSESLVLGIILSATTRDVSFCKNRQWKLHRLTKIERDIYYRNALSTFRARLSDYIAEASRLPKLLGHCTSIWGRSQDLALLLKRHEQDKEFDLVITSPPYGDSKSTVQYGALSSLCLGVVRHVLGLEMEFHSGGSIERNCLGGGPVLSLISGEEMMAFCLKDYWNGPASSHEAERLLRFASDLQHCCVQAAQFVAPNGRLVMIVGRRSVGGWRFYLDHFLADVMAKVGFEIEETWSRQIRNKITPHRINRYGRDPDRHTNWRAEISTIRTEFVTSFVRT